MQPASCKLTSALELSVANTARFEPFSENPIETSWATISSLGSDKPGCFELAGGKSGIGTSPACVKRGKTSHKQCH